MRICLVSSELAPWSGWGAGAYAHHMARAFASAGAEAHVLTFEREGLSDGPNDELDGATVHTFDCRSPPASWNAYGQRAMRHAMGAYHALLALHERVGFDAIEFPDFGAEGYFVFRARRSLQQFAGATLAVRAHTPISMCRGLNEQATLSWPDAVLEHMERTCLLEADALVSPSRALLEQIETYLPGVRRDGRPELAIANPLMPAGQQHHAPTHSDGGPPELLFFGRLEWRKGPDVLVDAACSLLEAGRELSVRLVGKDTSTAPFGQSMRRYIRERIGEAHQHRFHIDPAMPRRRLFHIGAGAAACVFPSRWENLAYAIAESMQLGRCVISTRAGGTPELIDHERSGLLATPGDAADLAGQIERVLDDPGLRARLGEAARARVAEVCDPARAAAATIEAYEAARPTGGVCVASPRSEAGVGDVGGDPPGRTCAIIPHYNTPEHLPEAIESLRGQTLAPDEIVIVDDGSSDERVPPLLGALEGQGVRVIRQRNRGVSAARNAGLRATDAPLVLFLDSDDILDPAFLERLRPALLREERAAYAFPYVRQFDEDPEEVTGGWIPLGLEERDLLMVFNCAGSTNGLLARREAIEDCGGFDESLPALEDWDLFCALAQRGWGSVIVPEFLIRYRRREGSLMDRFGRPQRDDLLAHLIYKHPGLPADAQRVMRLLVARAAHFRRRSQRFERAARGSPPPPWPPALGEGRGRDGWLRRLIRAARER